MHRLGGVFSSGSFGLAAGDGLGCSLEQAMCYFRRGARRCFFRSGHFDRGSIDLQQAVNGVQLQSPLCFSLTLKPQRQISRARTCIRWVTSLQAQALVQLRPAAAGTVGSLLDSGLIEPSAGVCPDTPTNVCQICFSESEPVGPDRCDSQNVRTTLAVVLPLLPPSKATSAS